MNKCLIIAAGQGTRLATMGDSKPLVPLAGIPLIERVILTFMEAGVTDFHVVTGYNSDKIRDHLTPFCQRHPITINFIHNDEWKKANGISVLKGRETMTEPFFLSMSDHLFDAAIITDFRAEGIEKGQVKLAVDKRIENNPLIDIDDVTKVLVEGCHISDIGKTIPQYNAFDTGIFLCTPAIFDALAESIEEGDSSLSGGIRKMGEKQKALVFDIGDRDWLDVDDEAAFKKAENIFASKQLTGNKN